MPTYSSLPPAGAYAAGSQTLSNFDAVLKEFYGPGLVENLNQEVPMLALLQKDSNLIKFDGRRFIVPVHTARNSGIGSRAESAVLPTAGSQKYVDYSVQPSYIYGGIKVSGQVIQQTRTDAGAFGRVLQVEMEGLKNDFKTELNFQFLGDGNGVRAIFTATGTSVGADTPITLDTPVPYNVLNENMVLDLYALTAGGVPTGAAVTTAAVVKTVALTTTGNFYVTSVNLVGATGTIVSGTRYGFVRASSFGNDLQGLGAVIGSGTYGGISSTTNAAWQSVVLSNGGTNRPINYSLFQTAIDGVKNASGGSPKYFFTKPEIRKNFYLFMSSERRIIDTRNYEGGFDSVVYDGKEIFVDQMMPNNTMYGIDPDYLYRLETREPHWIDDDGTILHRSFDSTDTYFANMRYYVNLGCTKRNAQVKIADITQ
jgi:hypothetical protein